MNENVVVLRNDNTKLVIIGHRVQKGYGKNTSVNEMLL